MTKTARGFTLVELLIVIAIIAILGGVIFFVVNPFELQRQSRDTVRIQDLNNLTSAINVAAQSATSSGSQVLCNGGSAPCSGSSYPLTASTRKSDGTGWVKVNLSSVQNLSFPTLPVDPTNDGTYNYSYATNATGDQYEIDAVFESNKYKPQMATDGGNDDNKYERGTNLTII